jgi:LmbE family N-acetylglucosaminyl deacetylase
MFGSRILLLAPHPDDEVAGCCAAIRRARTQGSSVFVLFLTTGVPSPQRLWPWDRPRHPARVDRRRREARGVCTELGAKIACFSPAAARDLKNDLGTARNLIIEQSAACGADTLWVPAYEGGHPDHDLANFLASTLREGLTVWEYSEYNFSGGRVRCNEFISRTGEETELTLSDEERRFKKTLLAMYASERGNLNYLRTEREVFRPLAEYDYSRPPHPGTLFYRRFAWAAIHPRVNHVRPAEVSRSIAEFRAQH